jgi:hypothetical protein
LQKLSEPSGGVLCTKEEGVSECAFGGASGVDHTPQYNLVRPTAPLINEARSWAGRNLVAPGDAYICIVCDAQLVCVVTMYFSKTQPSAMVLTLDDSQNALNGERLALGVVQTYATITNVPVMVSRNLSPSWERVSGTWVYPS